MLTHFRYCLSRGQLKSWGKYVRSRAYTFLPQYELLIDGPFDPRHIGNGNSSHLPIPLKHNWSYEWRYARLFKKQSGNSKTYFTIRHINQTMTFLICFHLSPLWLAHHIGSWTNVSHWSSSSWRCAFVKKGTDNSVACRLTHTRSLSRSHAEQQLQNELNKTRAQAARLEGEVTRMRRRMDHQLASGRATTMASQQLEELPLLGAEQRKAILVEAIPAAQKETASITALQRYFHLSKSYLLYILNGDIPLLSSQTYMELQQKV